jgi:hypothetical protein
VLALHGLGLNFSEISRRTGLPYYTVIKWRPKARGTFEPMRITAGESGSLVVAPAAVTKLERRHQVATVTVASFDKLSVVLANGVRVEGVTPKTLLKILPSLGGLR